MDTNTTLKTIDNFNLIKDKILEFIGTRIAFMLKDREHTK